MHARVPTGSCRMSRPSLTYLTVGKQRKTKQDAHVPGLIHGSWMSLACARNVFGIKRLGRTPKFDVWLHRNGAMWLPCPSEPPGASETTPNGAMPVPTAPAQLFKEKQNLHAKRGKVKDETLKEAKAKFDKEKAQWLQIARKNFEAQKKTLVAELQGKRESDHIEDWSRNLKQEC